MVCGVRIYLHKTGNNARYMKKPELQETILGNIPKSNSSASRFDKIIPPPMGITINPTGGMKKEGLVCSRVQGLRFKEIIRYNDPHHKC